MKLGSEKGIKTGTWFSNEILRMEDINFVGEGTYQNLTDLLATLAKQGISTGSTKDIVIAGLLLEWNNLLTSDFRAGMAVSYSGYYMAADSTWAFQASGGDIFSVHVSKDQSVAVDAGGAQARYDTLEIRPIQTKYDAKSRQFKDPITEIVTSSIVNTKLEYGYEFQVLKGTEGAGVAPTHTAGWIKIAEIYVAISASSIDQSDIKDVRDSDTWTTEANNTKYKEPYIGEKVTSSPTGGTATSLSKETTIKAAVDELFARLRNMSGVQNNAVVNRHIGPLAVRQAEVDLGVDVGDVDADVLPLGSVVASSPTGGTATNLAAASFVRAALQEILDRLKNASGIQNLAIVNRHLGDNVVRQQELDLGVDVGDVDADVLPLGQIVASNPTGGTATSLPAASFVRAALVEIFLRLKNLSGVENNAILDRHIGNDQLDSRHYKPNSVDEEHLNWGTGSGQIGLLKGHLAVILTQWDTNTQPQIAAVGSCEINGGLYTNPSAITITGSTSNSTWYEILLTPSGTTYTASFIARGTGVWSDSKQGLYSGNNRVVAVVRKDGSGNFINKNILNIQNRKVIIQHEIGGWDLDADPGKSVALLWNEIQLRTVHGVLRTDPPAEDIMWAIPGSDASASTELLLKTGQISSYSLAVMRLGGSSFDSTTFDDDTFNRGWLEIMFEV